MPSLADLAAESGGSVVWSEAGSRILFARVAIAVPGRDLQRLSTWAVQFVERHSREILPSGGWSLELESVLHDPDGLLRCRFRQTADLPLIDAALDLSFSRGGSTLEFIASTLRSAARPGVPATPPQSADSVRTLALVEFTARFPREDAGVTASTPVLSWVPSGQGRNAVATAWVVRVSSPVLPHGLCEESWYAPASLSLVGRRLRRVPVDETRGEPRVVRPVGSRFGSPVRISEPLDVLRADDALALLNAAAQSAEGAVHAWVELLADYDDPHESVSSPSDVRFVERLGQNTWCVRTRATTAGLLALADEARILSVRAIRPADRDGLDDFDLLGSAVERIAVAIAPFADVSSRAAVRGVLGLVPGAVLLRDVGGEIVFSMPPSQVASVLGLDDVRRCSLADLDEACVSDASACDEIAAGACATPLGTVPWIRQQLGLPDDSTNGSGVIVGLIDHDHPSQHEQFSPGAIRHLPGQGTREGWHATAAAGVMLSRGIQTDNVAEDIAPSFRGIAPGVSVVSATGRLAGEYESALTQLAAEGARVICSELGSPDFRGRYTSRTRTIDSIVWSDGSTRGRPVLVLVAGNKDRGKVCTHLGERVHGKRGRVRSTNTAKNALAVGATYCAEVVAPDTPILTRFSCDGAADGRRKPDVCAWGETVPLVVVKRDKPYFTWDGTSFAAPAVAGLAALVIEAMQDPGANPATVRAIIAHSAVSVRNSVSWGQPRAALALETAAMTGGVRRWHELDVPVDRGDGTLVPTRLTLAECDSYLRGDDRLPGSQEIEVGVLTVAWDDPPGPAGSTAVLVHGVNVTAAWRQRSDGASRSQEWRLQVDNLARVELEDCDSSAGVVVDLSFVRLGGASDVVRSVSIVGGTRAVGAKPDLRPSGRWRVPVDRPAGTSVSAAQARRGAYGPSTRGRHG